MSETGIFERIFGERWVDLMAEKQPRVPSGSAAGGQFASTGGAKAPETGAGSGSLAPHWAGEKHIIVDDLDVYNGKFSGNRDKWAVADSEGSLSSNWAETPKLAVENYRSSEKQRVTNVEVSQRIASGVAQARAGSKAGFDVVTGGKDILDKNAAIGVMRQLGLRDKDARGVIGKLPIERLSSGGYSLYRSDKLWTKYLEVKDRIAA